MHDDIRDVIPGDTVVGFLAAYKAPVYDHQFTVVFKPQSDRFHAPATTRFPVSRRVIYVPGPQTQRAMIAVFGAYWGVGDDGTTRQTPERVLIRTKPCLEATPLNIHTYYSTLSSLGDP